MPGRCGCCQCRTGSCLPTPLPSYVPICSALLDEPESSGSDGIGGRAEQAEGPTVRPGGRVPAHVAAVLLLLGTPAAQLARWRSLSQLLDAAREVPAGLTNGRPPAAGGTTRPEALSVTRHFDDVRIDAHSLTWWGAEGLQLLAGALHGAQARYNSSLQDDAAQLATAHMPGCPSKQALGGTGAGSASAQVAAMQLRLGERTALQDALAAVQRVLHGGRS